MPDAGGTGDGYSIGEFENKVLLGAGETSVAFAPNNFNPLNTDRFAYALIPVSFRAAPDDLTTRSPQFTVDFDWDGDWSDVFAASSDIEFLAINPVLGWDGLNDTITEGRDVNPLHYADLASLPGGDGYAANQGSPTGLGSGGPFHITRSVEFWATQPSGNVIPDDYVYPSGNPPGGGPWFDFNILLLLTFGRVFEGAGDTPHATFSVYQTWDGPALPDFEPCPPHVEWPYPPEALGIDAPDTGVIRVGLR